MSFLFTTVTHCFACETSLIFGCMFLVNNFCSIIMREYIRNRIIFLGRYIFLIQLLWFYLFWHTAFCVAEKELTLVVITVDCCETFSNVSANFSTWSSVISSFSSNWFLKSVEVQPSIICMWIASSRIDVFECAVIGLFTYSSNKEETDSLLSCRILSRRFKPFSSLRNDFTSKHSTKHHIPLEIR